MGEAQASYRTQRAWRDIQSFLPADYRIEPDREPREEWWEWRGHRVHLDRFPHAAAPAKVILFHGIGTNGRQMSLILGAPLFRSGLETVAVDMPGFGVTMVAQGTTVTYDDWVQAANDLIDAELARDSRPIVLFGFSLGGVLTYHAAAVNRKVKGIAGTTFLDLRVREVADESAYSKAVNRIGMPMTHFAVQMGLGSMKVPLRLVTKMRTLVNDRTALAACLKDRTSAGNSMPLKFLSTCVSYRPLVEPEAFNVCPILLTQPAKDRWTPLHLSELFLPRVTRVPTAIVMLENAGHYPIEQPGLKQMHDAVLDFVRRCVRGLGVDR